MATHPSMLSDNELDCLTSAFRSLETGVRGATINQENIQAAMLMVGLNPSDQECVDIPNEFARLGQANWSQLSEMLRDKVNPIYMTIFNKIITKYLHPQDLSI